VQERTAEIATQRDEIQLKSESLENALAELSNTQRELIRQEKMATAGKLTQGLIDRILNPLNYINNFSKLSIGLVGDIAANIEDDKDKMDEENYEDTVDVLEMLKGNLQKVADHGLNTTRTLKAMEELLKDRTGGMVATDIKKVLKKNEEVVSKYHESCINKYGIKVTFDLPEEDMPFEGNPEQLSKTFMSIINNGFYAVVKKAEKIKYTPEVRVSAQIEDNGYIIKFYDNGIGIEQTITDKVFDPFFTTKPTGEAAGVGLYLSREIIQNHHGEISVTSEKDKFSEFTVEFQIVNSI
jgi:signal transduction histidine kinase